MAVDINDLAIQLARVETRLDEISRVLIERFTDVEKFKGIYEERHQLLLERVDELRIWKTKIIGISIGASAMISIILRYLFK